jgi:hypothetical protein
LRHEHDVPLREEDALIEVPSEDFIGGYYEREYYICVLFGVNSVAGPRRGAEALLPAKFRLPVANCPHPSVRPHPVAAAWQAPAEDETVDIENDQKFITFHRCVTVEEFERGTRVTLDQPIVIFAKRERRFEMSVVSSATFTYGHAEMWTAREWGHMSVESGDPLIVTYQDGRLVLSSIAFAVWIVRGWYVESFARRHMQLDDRFDLGSFSSPFEEVQAARRIQRFWRRRSCDPHHPVGNRLLRLEFERAGLVGCGG